MTGGNTPSPLNSEKHDGEASKKQDLFSIQVQVPVANRPKNILPRDPKEMAARYAKPTTSPKRDQSPQAPGENADILSVTEKRIHIDPKEVAANIAKKYEITTSTPKPDQPITPDAEYIEKRKELGTTVRDDQPSTQSSSVVVQEKKPDSPLTKRRTFDADNLRYLPILREEELLDLIENNTLTVIDKLYHFLRPEHRKIVRQHQSLKDEVANLYPKVLRQVFYENKNREDADILHIWRSYNILRWMPLLDRGLFDNIMRILESGKGVSPQLLHDNLSSIERKLQEKCKRSLLTKYLLNIESLTRGDIDAIYALGSTSAEGRMQAKTELEGIVRYMTNMPWQEDENDIMQYLTQDLNQHRLALKEYAQQKKNDLENPPKIHPDPQPAVPSSTETIQVAPPMHSTMDMLQLYSAESFAQPTPAEKQPELFTPILNSGYQHILEENIRLIPKKISDDTRSNLDTLGKLWVSNRLKGDMDLSFEKHFRHGSLKNLELYMSDFMLPEKNIEVLHALHLEQGMLVRYEHNGKALTSKPLIWSNVPRFGLKIVELEGGAGEYIMPLRPKKHLEKVFQTFIAPASPNTLKLLVRATYIQPRDQGVLDKEVVSLLTKRLNLSEEQLQALFAIQSHVRKNKDFPTHAEQKKEAVRQFIPLLSEIFKEQTQERQETRAKAYFDILEYATDLTFIDVIPLFQKGERVRIFDGNAFLEGELHAPVQLYRELKVGEFEHVEGPIELIETTIDNAGRNSTVSLKIAYNERSTDPDVHGKVKYLDVSLISIPQSAHIKKALHNIFNKPVAHLGDLDYLRTVYLDQPELMESFTEEILLGGETWLFTPIFGPSGGTSEETLGISSTGEIGLFQYDKHVGRWYYLFKRHSLRVEVNERDRLVLEGLPQRNEQLPKEFKKIFFNRRGDFSTPWHPLRYTDSELHPVLPESWRTFQERSVFLEELALAMTARQRDNKRHQQYIEALEHSMRISGGGPNPFIAQIPSQSLLQQMRALVEDRELLPLLSNEATLFAYESILREHFSPIYHKLRTYIQNDASCSHIREQIQLPQSNDDIKALENLIIQLEVLAKTSAQNSKISDEITALFRCDFFAENKTSIVRKWEVFLANLYKNIHEDNGMVLDHIPSRELLLCMRILQTENSASDMLIKDHFGFAVDQLRKNILENERFQLIAKAIRFEEYDNPLTTLEDLITQLDTLQQTEPQSSELRQQLFDLYSEEILREKLPIILHDWEELWKNLFEQMHLELLPGKRTHTNEVRTMQNFSREWIARKGERVTYRTDRVDLASSSLLIQTKFGPSKSFAFVGIQARSKEIFVTATEEIIQLENKVLDHLKLHGVGIYSSSKLAKSHREFFGLDASSPHNLIVQSDNLLKAILKEHESERT